MCPTRNHIKLCLVLVCANANAVSLNGQETPRAIVQAAIKGHGGEKNLAKTLTGSLSAKATSDIPPGSGDSISWEETFELPRRYHRMLRGQSMGREFAMEYGITDGSGWIRYNGETKDYKGEKVPLYRNWNAFLAMLPAYLADGVELKSAGVENVQDREAVAIKVRGESVGIDAVLMFDSKSHLLVKRKGRMQHPLTGEEVEGETIYSDFKEVSGVQYPHRLTTYLAGKKVSEMEIVRLEFLDKIDDRLFEKP